jgi:homoserine O-succinyltransferase/O-acetyltransferase
MIMGGMSMTRTKPFGGRPPLEIGLLNNMPDAAMHATEQQFKHLLAAAGTRHPVRLRFYSLPEVPRGVHTRTYMDTLYGELDEMFELGLDGLIVTGAEPRAERLEDEPYWTRLTQVIDWTEANVAGSYWSCLAAHAVVRHLDGVERIRLPAKCSGVFETGVVTEDRLLAHMPSPIRAPHSRLNGLDEQALVDAGYTILTRSPEVGVDLFARRSPRLMLFSQGHPEYDADTLLWEYCRDVGRYLNGRQDSQPTPPTSYLSARTRAAFEAASRRRRDPALIARYNAIAVAAKPRQAWRAASVALFRNWLSQIASAKARPASPRRAPRPTLTSLPA